jgi:hypothetical protein
VLEHGPRRTVTEGLSAGYARPNTPCTPWLVAQRKRLLLRTWDGHSQKVMLSDETQSAGQARQLLKWPAMTIKVSWRAMTLNTRPSHQVDPLLVTPRTACPGERPTLCLKGEKVACRSVSTPSESARNPRSKC